MILIVSNSLSAAVLAEKPFFLSPDEIMISSFESLAFIGLSRFSTIILHEPPADLIPKLALGIKDSSAIEALWSIFNRPRPIPVKILVPAPIRPLQSWQDLNIEVVVPGELSKLAAEPVFAGGQESRTDTCHQPMTADEVRELHQKGVTHLPPDRPLTDWAREIAGSLGMGIQESLPSLVLIELNVSSIRELQTLSGPLHAWRHANPAVYYVIPPVYFPVFHSFFPSLRGSLVSASYHWADKGAFTGETSFDMLADAGCRGIILAGHPPFGKPEHLRKSVEAAVKRGMLVFSTFPLDRQLECDIMSTRSGPSAGTPWLIPLEDRRGREKSAEPVRGGVLIQVDDFKESAGRKGRQQ